MNDFVFGAVVGTLAAGTAMYYIQPTIKVWVAKAFGSEAAVIAKYNALVLTLKASQASKS